MQVPVWIKPAVWGAIFGALGIMIVGFSWMGWTLGHTTTRLVAEARESGMIAALTPFCVSSYLKQPDAAGKLALLRADTSVYSQRDIIEKAGFATMPGNTEPSSGLAAACAVALKTVSLADPERQGPTGGAEANTMTKTR
ncbi:MAG: hypothetical protein ACREKS_03220 [Candidatus Rokuibacteriota bacterium]